MLRPQLKQVDRIYNVLKRDTNIFAKSKDGLFDVVSLTPDKLDEVINLTRKHFFRQEAVCKALGLYAYPKSCKEVEEFFWSVANEGVSVVGVEKKSGKIFGMLYNKLWIKGQESSYENFTKKWKEEPAQMFAEYMVNSTSCVDIYKTHNVTCIFETMFGMVDSEFENKKLGQLLIEGSLRIAKSLSHGENCRTSLNDDQLELVVPDVAMAITTSEAAKKALDKQGFQAVDKISMDTFFNNNKQLAELFQENASSITVSLRDL